MRKITLIFLFVITANVFYAQAPFRIQAKCAAPNNRVNATVTATASGINQTPCPTTGSNLFGITNIAGNANLTGRVRVGDANFNAFGTSDIRFQVTPPNSTLYAPTAAGYFTTAYHAVINGSGGVIANRWVNLQARGTVQDLVGDWIYVDNRLATGTSFMRGVDIWLNVEATATTASGLELFVAPGGSGANGTTNLYGLHVTAAGGHNANVANPIVGNFDYTSTITTIGTVSSPIARGIRIGMNNRPNNLITEFRGLSIDNWSTAATIGTSSAIFIDASAGGQATTNYVIQSVGSAPSKFGGDLYISDSTQGIILRSPDQTCYRYTAANGGALNAGVAVTCP